MRNNYDGCEKKAIPFPARIAHQRDVIRRRPGSRTGELCFTIVRGWGVVILRAMSASTQPRQWKWWAVPSLTQGLWLALLLVLLSPWWRTFMVNADGDALFHWRVGSWMLQHRRVIRQDVFSHTRYGAPIISKEWLAEVIFATAGEWLSIYGLCLVAALVIATTFAVLHRQLLRAGNEPLVATLLVLLAAWVSRSHWLARPHIFTLLLAVIWHGTLQRYERDGAAGRLAMTLAGLTVLWVNLHGGYLVGFLILGAFIAGAIVSDRRKVFPLAGILMLCATVSLINPNGWRLHIHNIEFLQSNFLTGWIKEYSSPDFHVAGPRVLLVWLGLIFVTLVWHRPRWSAGSAILVAMWVYFALYAGRNIPLLALLSAPVITPPWSAWVRQRWPTFSNQVARANAGACGWPVIGVLAVLAILYLPRPVPMLRALWPVDAVRYIREHPDQFRGEMFNDYRWGGYLLAVLPDHRVFVDGRTDFYGEPLLREFLTAAEAGAGWADVFNKYGVRWTLLPTPHRLNQALAGASGWQCLYTDECATIYGRKQ
jgi:hypothetical protein